MGIRIFFPRLKRGLVAPAPPAFWVGFWMAMGGLMAYGLFQLSTEAASLFALWAFL